MRKILTILLCIAGSLIDFPVYLLYSILKHLLMWASVAKICLSEGQTTELYCHEFYKMSEHEKDGLDCLARIF